VPDLNHGNHTGVNLDVVGDELRMTITVEPGLPGEDGVGVPTGGATNQVLKKASAADHDTVWATESGALAETVAGGSGFINASGNVTLDLANARVFQLLVTGAVTSVAFSNIPNANTTAAEWVMVLKLGATPYGVLNLPTVTFLDGSSWADLNLAANAFNVVYFERHGATTYAYLGSNGLYDLDPYKLSFAANGTVVLATESEELDLRPTVGFTKPTGNGAITFKKNGAGGDLDVKTNFAVGDYLLVTCASLTTATAVRIPRRYLP
jgi:hypothetical protein